MPLPTDSADSDRSRPTSASVEADAPVLALTVVGLVEGAALFLEVLAILLLTVGHTEHVEEFLYVIAFVGILPVAVLSGLWRARRLGPDEVSALATLDALGLVLVLVAARLAGRATPVLLAGGLVLLVANELLVGSLRPALSIPSLRRVSLRMALAPLAFGAVLPFVRSSAWSSGRVELCLGVAAVLTATYTFLRRRVHVRSSWMVDGIAALLIVAVVWDVFWWSGYLHWGDAQLTHQNFYLGPTNELLHGRTMLVDMFSQYGVGVMYFLAGIFSVVPIGYGTFSIVNSALFALELVALYGVVRLATRSQLLAVATAAVAVPFVALAQVYSFVLYPSTGPLRFGPPFAVILLEVLAARLPDRRRSLQLASAAVIGALSLWSFETFVYALAAYVAIVLFEAAMERDRDLLRRRLLALAAALLAAQLVFAVATRVASGSWPAWRTYLAYVRQYSVGELATLPVSAWSPGLVLAAACFASALLLALLVIRRPRLVAGRPELFLGLAGSTAFAILAYTYFLGRSHPNNLHHVAPPAIAMCALWLGALTAARRPAVGAGFLLLGLWAGLMLATNNWKHVEANWKRSALGTAVTASPSKLAHRVRFLAERPIVDPRAAEGARLLRTLDPGASRSLVLVNPLLQAEVLLRAGRGNALPIAHPFQDVLSSAGIRRVLDAVPRLRPGTTMLTESQYLASQIDSDSSAPLTELAVWEVRRHFALQPVTQTADGLSIVRLG